MNKWTFDQDEVAQGILALKSKGRIPMVTLGIKEAALKRFQHKLYASAIRFSAPTVANDGDPGRYNPPNGSVSVWYAADASITALAESLGRIYHLQGIVSYPQSALAKKYICSVDIINEVKVIDVVKLCTRLHIPLDSIENENYAFTQWLMVFLHTHFQSDADGLSYRSRHHDYKRCYAFWESKGKPCPFQDTRGGMVSVLDYKEYDSQILPKGWGFEYMSGDDMLEEILEFTILANL